MVTGAAAMGATRAQQVRYVIFPHMVAAVFAGLRARHDADAARASCWRRSSSRRAASASSRSLYSETFNPAALMALVLTLALMAIALNELVRLVEARFSRWKD